MSALELTLDPVGREAFLAGHWERAPLALARSEPGRFDGVLSLEDADRLASATGIRAPAFRLVRDGAQIPLAEYAEDVPWRPGSFTAMARVDRLAEEFAAGATLVLQGLHLHWHPAALFCRELEIALGMPVQANAYLTPATAQGFSVHHDLHDVFVLQVAGRKRWSIYAPLIELPAKTQSWSPALGDPGPPVDELVLEPGDTLYLPRGWPHEAATGEGQSLHLTVGLHPPTRLDALRAALEECVDDVEFRRSAPADGVLPANLLARLGERLEPPAVARRMRRRFVAGRRPILADQLDQVRGLDRLAPSTRVERRPTVIADLELTEGGGRLQFEGKEVVFPPHANAALAAAHAADRPFTAAELPGELDEPGRVVLVRRLVREGFLRVTEY